MVYLPVYIMLTQLLDVLDIASSDVLLPYNVARLMIITVINNKLESSLAQLYTKCTRLRGTGLPDVHC